MKQDYTHITLVLDRSGSMATIADATINGTNEFITAHKNAEGEATLSLIQFDGGHPDSYRVDSWFTPLNDIQLLNNSTYNPRGLTALFDAIGRAIIDTGTQLDKMPEAMKPELVIFVINTDGLENCSQEFTDADRLMEMIKHQTEKYNWQFVFLGANQDAILSGNTIGINSGMSITYTAVPDSVNAVYSSMTANTLGYRATKNAGNLQFNDSDRNKVLSNAS